MKTFIETIWDLAKDYHRGQVRKFSEFPYYTHLEKVAYLTKLYGNRKEDCEYTIAAIFHDSEEDCIQVTKDKLIGDLTEIYTQYQYTIPENRAKMVEMFVAELTHNYDYNNMSYAALTIKLADRIDNMTDCIYFPTPVKMRHKYIKDTPKLIYAAKQKIPENKGIYVLENLVSTLSMC